MTLTSENYFKSYEGSEVISHVSFFIHIYLINKCGRHMIKLFATSFLTLFLLVFLLKVK